jgi:CheY-like chemotaxis protein
LLGFPSAQLQTVLVVDDSDDMRALFRRYLSGGPYRVVESGRCDEVVDLVQRERADCVILDVMMPSRDGWDVLQSLRGHPETRAVPVIVCTVLRQRALALSLGATDFLTKPVTRDALLSSLRRVAPAPGR